MAVSAKASFLPFAFFWDLYRSGTHVFPPLYLWEVWCEDGIYGYGADRLPVG